MSLIHMLVSSINKQPPSSECSTDIVFVFNVDVILLLQSSEIQKLWPVKSAKRSEKVFIYQLSG